MALDGGDEFSPQEREIAVVFVFGRHRSFHSILHRLDQVVAGHVGDLWVVRFGIGLRGCAGYEMSEGAV